MFCYIIHVCSQLRASWLQSSGASFVYKIQLNAKLHVRPHFYQHLKWRSCGNFVFSKISNMALIKTSIHRIWETPVMFP